MRLAQRLAYSLLLALAPLLPAVGQSPWRTYLSYSATKQVAETPQLLFALSTEGTLLSFPKQHPEASRSYAREDGLSEAQASAIAYSPETGTLLIYYPSGMIDLLRDRQVLPVQDLKRSPRIQDYRLSALRLAGERAYLVGGFGLIEVGLSQGTIPRSAFLGEAIQGVALLPEGRLVILRQGELLVTDLASPWQSPAQWSPLPLPADFPRAGWQAVTDDGSRLWLLSSEGIVYTLAPTGQGGGLPLEEQPSRWEQLTSTPAGIVLTRGDLSLLCRPDQPPRVLPGLFARHFSALHPSSLWAAAGSEGIAHYTQTPSGEWSTQHLRPQLNAPATDVHFALRTAGGYLYSVNGGRNFDRYYTPGVIQAFDGHRWQAWTATSLQQANLPALYDPVDVLPHPDGDPTHLYVASWGDGLFELQAGTILRAYGLDNSPLHSITPGASQQVRVSSLALDRSGRLFLAQGMSGSTSGFPVRSLAPDGSWRAYDYPEAREVNAFHTQVILPQGTKWLAEHALTTGAPGVLVYQDKGTARGDDDEHARYSSFVEPSGKAISFSRITALKVDRASRLWVGMDIGYGRVLRPELPPRAGVLPIVQRPVGGSEPPYYYLLGGLTVTAIEVDALDRKWMGTDGEGLYLLSAEGDEVLAHYTMESSPLVSDHITSLAFEERSGILYIGTSMGLSALSTHAGEAGGKSASSAYAFPNPLRPEHPAGITFRELPAGARLRIEDASGVVRAVLESPTSELHWDTLSSTGERLPSGVYLVTIYPPTGGKPQVLKLALLRP